MCVCVCVSVCVTKEFLVKLQYLLFLKEICKGKVTLRVIVSVWTRSPLRQEIVARFVAEMAQWVDSASRSFSHVANSTVS